MSRAVRFGLFAALAAGAFGFAGCQTPHYRSETVLLPDGSVERAIYQPDDATPAKAKDPRHWQRTTYAPPPQKFEQEGWFASIRTLPDREKDKEHPYFAAWGRFARVNDIPTHVDTKPAEKGLPEAGLRRLYERTDYGLVVEHRWEETLQDVVTLDGMRKARDEWIDLEIKVLEDAFADAVGADYDPSAFIKWLRTDGKALAAALADHYFLHRALNKGEGRDQELVKALAGVCARHGLKVDLKAGSPQQALEKALEDFWIGQLCRHVRRKKDGKPVDRATARNWFFRPDGAGAVPGQEPLLSETRARVIDQKYGGKEAFAERELEYAVRVFGLYWLGTQRFHYTMTMPGVVVETNGQLLAGSRVRWQFEASEAYPLGYPMRCRSLVADVQAQKRLLPPGHSLETREAMLDFLELVRGRNGLAAALRECRENKDVGPLYAYRTKVSKQADEEAAVNRLLKLLRLPAEPPKSP